MTETTDMTTDELPLPKKPEVIANELTRKLHEFLTSGKTPEEMDEMLPDLATYILENVTIDSLKTMVDKEFQKKLDSAIAETLTTPLVNPLDGSAENPWEGPNSIVMINGAGLVFGASFTPSERLKDYGDLSRFALLKAVFEAYLDAAKMEGGLNNPTNIAHLIRERGEGKTTLKPFEQVFTGSAIRNSQGNRLYIGSSGSTARNDYISNVLAGAEPGPETLAGAFDTAFSELIGDRVSKHSSNITNVEPTSITAIRIQN